MVSGAGPHRHPPVPGSFAGAVGDRGGVQFGGDPGGVPFQHPVTHHAQLRRQFLVRHPPQLRGPGRPFPGRPGWPATRRSGRVPTPPGCAAVRCAGPRPTRRAGHRGAAHPGGPGRPARRSSGGSTSGFVPRARPSAVCVAANPTVTAACPPAQTPFIDSRAAIRSIRAASSTHSAGQLQRSLHPPGHHVSGLRAADGVPGFDHLSILRPDPRLPQYVCRTCVLSA